MREIALGYMPLVDAAPLIVAAEFGFAEEEGLHLSLLRAASWSMLRDMLDIGHVAAAQMLSVVPVARALGLGGGTELLETPMVLSLNGQVIGLSADLPDIGFGDPVATGAALRGLGRKLRVGVPFPFSMQAELLTYWTERAGGAAVEVRTIPPPRMAEAMRMGEIDGFCVGEPWGSHAVDTAGARLVLPGSAIWSQAPEKVLATRAGWAETEPELAGRLLRALWRAGRWAGNAANRTTLAEVLSRAAYLDLPPDLIDRALSHRLLVTPLGPEAEVPQFQSFHDGLANFPWRSQAAWIGARLASRFGLDRAEAMTSARAVFRSDLFRQHLAPIGAPLPRASDKVEGALLHDETLPAVHGQLILARNRFFDGAIFDPFPLA
ncbi:MAG TPA: CmpA/NrtA family ABC transporter substrate-binding protein [Albidovulum sp.]|uniref:CmpA/NrtA family ABC transporter substrate-binding protein n=1 Tax=Albidovulum sp. TaxID=1872424 RepID=UPI002C940C4B|nr:CmpA/NrtA family ABC transporter substrate-binding protein [Albidovulum sp.]